MRVILVRITSREPDTSENLGANRIKTLKKLIVSMGLLLALGAIPMMAQITNQVRRPNLNL